MSMLSKVCNSVALTKHIGKAINMFAHLITCSVNVEGIIGLLMFKSFRSIKRVQNLTNYDIFVNTCID